MHPALTLGFYEHLAWQLSSALSGSADTSRRRYWCDGILAPEWPEDYQPQYVRRTRQLRLRAWIAQGPSKGGGSGVQTIWPLTVQLGPHAYAAYLRGGSMDAQVPAPENDDWVLIDPENQLLEVRLR